MATTIVRRVNLYVKTDTAGIIIEKFHGGAEMLGRQSWFVTDPPGPVPEGSYVWMSASQYIDIFVKKDPAARDVFFGLGYAPLVTVEKKGTIGAGTFGWNSLKIGGPSPPPPSHIHSRVATGFLPAQAIGWTASFAPGFNALPTHNSGDPLALNDFFIMIMRNIPQIAPATGCTCHATGRFAGSAIPIVNVLTKPPIDGFIDLGVLGAFDTTFDFDPTQVMLSNSAGFDQWNASMPLSNEPDNFISSLELTWRY